MLNVRRELEQIQYLSDSGAGDAGGAGDLRLVFDLAGRKQIIETNGEGHQFRHVGQTWRGRAFSRRGRRDAVLAACGGGGLELGLNMGHWVRLVWLELSSVSLLPKDFSPVGVSVIERLLS